MMDYLLQIPSIQLIMTFNLKLMIEVHLLILLAMSRMFVPNQLLTVIIHKKI